MNENVLASLRASETDTTNRWKEDYGHDEGWCPVSLASVSLSVVFTVREVCCQCHPVKLYFKADFLRFTSYLEACLFQI